MLQILDQVLDQGGFMFSFFEFPVILRFLLVGLVRGSFIILSLDGPFFPTSLVLGGEIEKFSSVSESPMYEQNLSLDIDGNPNPPSPMLKRELQRGFNGLSQSVRERLNAIIDLLPSGLSGLGPGPQVEPRLPKESGPQDLDMEAHQLGRLIVELDQILSALNPSFGTPKGLGPYGFWDLFVALNPSLGRQIQDLKSLLNKSYQRLHEIQTPLARKVLLFTGSKGEARLSLLKEGSGLKKETYFQTWLNLLLEKRRWIRNVLGTDFNQRLTGVRRTFQSGGFSSFEPQVLVLFEDYHPEESLHFELPSGLDGTMELDVFPLLVFGLEDSPVHRASLIQFIVEMDNIAEWTESIHIGYSNFMEWDARSSWGRRIGSLTLFRILDGLRYPEKLMAWKPSTRVTGFSLPLYFRQVLMVLHKLVEMSSDKIQRIGGEKIINRATFFTIRNTTPILLRKIGEQFGSVPNLLGSPSEDLRRLGEEVERLNNLMNGMGWGDQRSGSRSESGPNSESCERNL